MDNDFNKFLLANGYKEYPSIQYFPGGKDSKLFCKRVNTKFECTCNKKSVQFCIDYSVFLLPQKDVLKHLSINITACDNTDKWFSLKCYGISQEELMKNLNQIEDKLVKAWEAINEKTN